MCGKRRGEDLAWAYINPDLNNVISIVFILIFLLFLLYLLYFEPGKGGCQGRGGWDILAIPGSYDYTCGGWKESPPLKPHGIFFLLIRGIMLLEKGGSKRAYWAVKLKFTVLYKYHQRTWNFEEDRKFMRLD